MKRALFGLQKFNCESVEVCELLKMLTFRVNESVEIFDGQCVGNTLFGLHGMSSKKEEIKNLLKALFPKIKGCKEVLNNQAVSNALYGLSEMSSDEKEVRDMATFENPHQYSKGFKYVIVNGKVVVENGNHTGVRSGAVLTGPGTNKIL